MAVKILKINGKLHYLWRAVDQHGVVLDILVQDRRNATAAKRFFKRLRFWPCWHSENPFS